MDQEVPDLMSDFFLCLLAIMGMLLVICGVLPWFLVPAALMLALYWWVLKYYRKTSTGTSCEREHARTTVHANE